MNRIVLDTNVLVSGMINAHGAPGRIVDMVREEHVELVVDDRVLSLHYLAKVKLSVLNFEPKLARIQYALPLLRTRI